MNLDEAQRAKVADWIAQGLKLSEVQHRIASELGVHMTYIEVRFLVDDLKLTPKDTEPTAPTASTFQNSAPVKPRDDITASRSAPPTNQAGEHPAPSKQLSVSVDQITRPGAVVSGRVTFGDGNKAEWYLDEVGRLGLAPQQQGYRPPSAELQQFQIALEKELSKLGF